MESNRPEERQVGDGSLLDHYFRFPLRHPILIAIELSILFAIIGWLAFCYFHGDFRIGPRMTPLQSWIWITVMSLYHIAFLFFAWGVTVLVRICYWLSHWIGSIRHVK